ncbi:sensor histidine kinase [Streptomyces tauricus]|uniref:sensor histidine kinase n=1 Tax=Streptomyces tauricus TaxID=68274 RepID=UPI002243DFD9|nr:HAMP domain-containing sensor histidine kinase [Streptomyces tauricus]MCW8102783.1 HAMP domain-containing histidine kinase [Streptomyces tauricus]
MTDGPAGKRAAPRSPARKRLSRLQRRLTLAYTLITLAGVGALCWLVIRTDGRSWQAVEYEEMRRRAAVTASLIYYTDAGIQLDGLYDDEATSGRPEVLVLQVRRDGLRQVFTSRGSAQRIEPDTAARVARTAMARDDTVRTKGRTSAGQPVYLLGLPFYHDRTQQTSGAVVVVGDPAKGQAEHHRLVVAVLSGSGLLTLLVGVTGHVLSGRSLRPAAEALDAQERLLADAAHELRTPVAVMRGSVDLADADPGQLHVHLPRLRRATDRMTDVVDNILTRGRLQAGHAFRPVPLRLDQLVEQVCEELPPSRHTVTSFLDPSVVRADPELVRTAVRNLLANALRHGRTPGDPQDRAEVDITVSGTTVTVADRGVGVDPDSLPGLLVRYRSPGGGTGIGLSLVREIAAAHGGDVTVRRRPGGGSAFVLTLGPAPRSSGHRRAPRISPDRDPAS